MEAWVAWLMGLFRSEHIEFALFAAAFISATVLPGGSEAVLAGAVAGTPSRVVEFVLIAMLGNALGGMTGWCIGRFIPERKKEGKALAWLHKYGYLGPLMTRLLTAQNSGYWALLTTWLPLFGDALPIAAGWLRLKALPCFLLIALGKGLRYAVVAGAVLPLAA